MQKPTLLFASLFILLVSYISQAQENRHYNLKNKLAVEGYDPVAYFTSNSAKEGSKNHTVSYKGVVYYFENEANKETFKKNPAKYVPQYGGWCAYAMGESGDKVKIDPKTFKIKDGKLYLFYNFRGNNTLVLWNKDEKSLKSKADKNWQTILK